MSSDFIFGHNIQLRFCQICHMCHICARSNTSPSEEVPGVPGTPSSISDSAKDSLTSARWTDIRTDCPTCHIFCHKTNHSLPVLHQETLQPSSHNQTFPSSASGWHEWSATAMTFWLLMKQWTIIRLKQVVNQFGSKSKFAKDKHRIQNFSAQLTPFW